METTGPPSPAAPSPAHQEPAAQEPAAQEPAALEPAALEPAAPRWPSGRSLDGGADEVPLPPEVPGRLWLCGRRFVGPNPEAALTRVGARTIVCLCEAAELADRYPGYLEWLGANVPTRALWHPIPDLHAPDLDDARRLWAGLVARLEGGDRILLHCGAGIGRAGTVAAGLLVELGVSPADAVAHVAAHRPMAGPEVGAQAALLDELAALVTLARP